MTDDETPESQPQRNSLLGRIRTRRDEIAAAQFIDLPVPRWEDPVLKVRYGPLDHEVIRKGFQTQRKAKDKAAAEVNTNADLLIAACIGVFADEDGKTSSLHPNGPDEEWTRFDPDLAESLGLPEGSTARQVVRAVYFTDGDVIGTGRRIIEFSGYQLQEGDDELLGE